MKKNIVRFASLLILCAIIFTVAPISSSTALEPMFPGFPSSGSGSAFQNEALSESVRSYLSTLKIEPILKEYKSTAGNDRPEKIYPEIIKDYKKYVNLVGMIEAELTRGVEQAASAIGPTCRAQLDFKMPSWKYFASVLRVVNTAEGFLSIIRPTLSVQNGEGGGSMLSCTVEFEPLTSLADRFAKGDGSKYLSMRLTYAYLNTVYGETGRTIRYALPGVPKAMQDELVFPLQSYTKLRKSWYSSRDCGYRKHTGMDIHAKEGTKILSCTDGIVEYIGYECIPGNYVIVRDDLGYEYHYYHLLEIPDFLKQGQSVKAGDLVGLVGNTGNSSVNHLHITIISPNQLYIDPYKFMLAALKRSGIKK
ncbi:MAG: M23 family metallopeptidase [Bacillota bacterium]